MFYNMSFCQSERAQVPIYILIQHISPPTRSWANRISAYRLSTEMLYGEKKNALETTDLRVENSSAKEQGILGNANPV